ncbi:MAG TPA: YbjN domain-containing protein [Shinella sp.]|jgi:hypothetical protein|uniref:YbjN domain-containing protein n=1 Tax=Shinella sp. TaxID=1870904 RepID=UPI002E1676BA|nr:YbjN domain-containing protein [Shinella sp.]
MSNRPIPFGVTSLARLAAALAIAASLSAGEAKAQGVQLVDATDPQRLAQIFQANGFQASVARDSRGDPMIRSAAEGVSFVISFYGCRENANCRSIQYTVSFRMEKPPTLDEINRFNQTRSLGEASLTSAGLPRLSYFMTLEGGVSEANFLHAFGLWRSVLSAFVRHIGFRAG